MSFENGIRSTKVKLDYKTLKVQLDTIIHIIEQKGMLMILILIM